MYSISFRHFCSVLTRRFRSDLNKCAATFRCLAMFAAESVRPQFGHVFSLGLYTLARHYSGLTFPACTLSYVLVYLPLIFSYHTSSTSASRPSHTVSWFTFVFSLWKLSLHWRHLKLRSWCNSQCILFLWMPRSHLLLQIFPHTSHWNASVFCISLLLATILSSFARLPILLSHSLKCSVRSSMMSLFLSLSSPLFQLPTTSFLALSAFCSSIAGFSSFSPRFSFPLLSP